LLLYGKVIFDNTAGSVSGKQFFSKSKAFAKINHNRIGYGCGL
jgi:hypothetical protein